MDDLKSWPLRSATTADVLDGLNAALCDLFQETGASIDREQLKQLSARDHEQSLRGSAGALVGLARPAGGVAGAERGVRGALDQPLLAVFGKLRRHRPCNGYGFCLQSALDRPIK